ncbi:mpv17-like protein 2 [Anoplopoma fimbria]|uniref:mpv17-like protein 2 n=1 Tax=Anoplopoma fimbria TaxID=229290 RepID=UPI0023ED51B9|nr:mpv17-like protein 2 [Anoplopoma fimbria]
MFPSVGKRFLVLMQPLFQSRNLLLTNTLSGGVLFSLGDILQQSWENLKKPGRKQDWRRTGCMFTVGCSAGPLLHYWYIWLDGAFVGKALKTVAKKVLVDQVVASPFLGLWYFGGMGLLEGHTLSEGWTEYKNKFWELYKMDCCVWPPAQTISFFFLSPKFRVVYINFITFGWVIYLSYLKHRDDSQPSELL